MITIADQHAVLKRIEARMANGRPFTYGELCGFVPPGGERLADRTIQKWRRVGWIAFLRQQRQVVWSLTPKGIQEKGNA